MLLVLFITFEKTQFNIKIKGKIRVLILKLFTLNSGVYFSL